ncbi:21732_t:CDS:2, partial [Dentiscutata erythropus]
IPAGPSRRIPTPQTAVKTKMFVETQRHIWNEPTFIGIKVMRSTRPIAQLIIVPAIKPVKLSIPVVLTCLRKMKLRILEIIGGIPDITSAKMTDINLERI